MNMRHVSRPKLLTSFGFLSILFLCLFSTFASSSHKAHAASPAGCAYYLDVKDATHIFDDGISMTAHLYIKVQIATHIDHISIRSHIIYNHLAADLTSHCDDYVYGSVSIYLPSDAQSGKGKGGYYKVADTNWGGSGQFAPLNYQGGNNVSATLTYLPMISMHVDMTDNFPCYSTKASLSSWHGLKLQGDDVQTPCLHRSDLPTFS